MDANIPKYIKIVCLLTFREVSDTENIHDFLVYLIEKHNFTSGIRNLYRVRKCYCNIMHTLRFASQSLITFKLPRNFVEMSILAQ